MADASARARTGRGAVSRVTLAGEARQVDAVLPAHEPLGRMLPDLLKLIGDAVESPPRLRHLVTVGGEVLSGDATLAGAGITDGALLRVVREENAPPPPVVHDVTESAGEDTDGRAWRWGPPAQRCAAVVVTAGALVVAAQALRSAMPGGGAAAVLAVAAVVLAVLGASVAVAARGREPADPASRTGVLIPQAVQVGGISLVAGGGGAGGVAVWAAAAQNRWPGWVLGVTLVAVAAAVLALLGGTSPLGRAGLAGAGFTAAAGVIWAACYLAHLSGVRAYSVVAVVSVVLLGLMPRIALSTSGLTALDDRRSGGADVARREVHAALGAAHRGLTIAVAATAMSAAVAGGLLAHAAGRWTAPLAILIAAVLACRSRAFPLAAEVTVLLSGAVGLLFVLVLAWVTRPGGQPWAAFVVALAAAAVPPLLISIAPPEHVRIRLRRALDRIEAAAVIALLPVVIGVFGTYGRLLHVFT